MKTGLIIPRHGYGLLTLDGATRLTIALSPEGTAALERLATCSKSAAVDLAVRVLDAIACGKTSAVAQDLASVADYGHDACARIHLMADMLSDLASWLDGYAEHDIP